MKKIAAGLLSTLALGVAAGCNDGTGDTDQAKSVATEAVDNARSTATSAATAARDALPDVDWDTYGQETKRTIDDLAEKGNCDGLRAQLSAVEANDTDLTEYIKAQIAMVPCSTG